jgi:hypothetical protein
MSVKFDAAFLDRKMAEHRRWQHDVEKELLDEVMGEMAEALRMPAFRKRAEAEPLPFPELFPELEQFTGRGPQHMVRAR